MNKKLRILLTVAAALLLVVGAVSGTVAYLTDDTDEVANTFEPAGIDIELTETEHGPYKLIPSVTYDKNPIVSVVRPSAEGAADGTDVDIYLFVEFEEDGDPTTYLTYTSNLTEANGWKLVPQEENVWYRKVLTDDVTDCTDTACTASNPHWHLLAGDQITVKDSVNTDSMDDAANASLTYKAYAIQLKSGDGEFEPKDAWKQVEPQI